VADLTLRCALKLTHDATVAIADDAVLLASVEMEKVANRLRWSEMADFDEIEAVLRELNIAPDNIDRWIVDGWIADEPLRVGSRHQCAITVAGYREASPRDDMLSAIESGGLPIAGRDRSFVSYRHVTGHIMGAWATSPFARSAEAAFGLVWDGGMEPRLYHVDPRARGIACLGPLFHLLGHAYAYATRYFGPFRKIWASASNPENFVAGRLMAYVALGRRNRDLIEDLNRFYRIVVRGLASGDDAELDYRAQADGRGLCSNASDLFAALAKSGRCAGLPDSDVLLAVHEFIDELLVLRFEEHMTKLGIEEPINLCLSGGCALNIKWNQSLRGSRYVREIFVPPFPNDSGSAIGMIACDLFRAGAGALDWNPYLGPVLGPALPPVSSWSVQDCDLARLAALLNDREEPVVFLQGRAELGPRALGHRSILASARSVTMRDRLNALKGRESFRPVAPVCLEARASEIFDPGGRDPYMLFEHRVRANWRDRIPAVVHIDGSARLQTVAAHDNSALFTLLTEFDRLTGVPVLCNTSANFEGRGFFPDAASAAEWGGCRYIWSEGKLFSRRDGGAKA